MSPPFQTRSALATPPRLQAPASTYNEADRTFDTVAASEQPALILDFRSGGIIEEVLVAEGGTFPDRMPFLDSHRRGSTSDIVGSAQDFRREGTQWLATVTLATEDPLADAMAAKIRDGHITAVSIGYTVQEFETIPAGQKRTVAGRVFHASERPLRVVTRWTPHELSAVAVPADSNCQIRSTANSMRTAMPAIHTRQSRTGARSIGSLVSAMLQHQGVLDPSQSRGYIDPTSLRCVRLEPSAQLEREAEEGNELVKLPLIDILRFAARQDGVPSDGAPAEFLARLYHHAQTEGSTRNIQSLFEGVVGSRWVGGRDEPDSTEGILAERDVPQLKLASSVGVSPFGRLPARGRGSAGAHISFDAPAEGVALAEFTGFLKIDEQDLLDNTIHAFEKLTPEMMARAAYRIRPDLFASLLLSNPSMRDGTSLFHADHGNLLTGSALAEPTLDSATRAMGKQGENGVPLNINPRWLYVPKALERLGQRLTRDVERLDAESTPPPSVRSEVRLDNGIIDPLDGTERQGSESDWYLFGPQSARTFEARYRQGTNREPVLRTGTLTQGEWGWWCDIQHHVAVQALDWRGVMKCTG